MTTRCKRDETKKSCIPPSGRTPPRIHVHQIIDWRAMARSEAASTKQASVCQNPLPVPIHSFRTDIVQRNKLELQRSFQHDFILLLQAPEKQIMAMKLNLFPYVLWRGGQCGPTAILSNCAVSFNAKPEFSLTLSLGVWHTDQNFIRSFWEWCDGTHKTWPTILVAFIG